MIDLSQLRSAGWEQVVRELTAPVPDDRAFLHRLTAVLGQVASARQAAFLSVPTSGDTPPGVQFLWPTVPGEKTSDVELEQRDAVASAARSAVGGSSVRVFGLENEELFYDTGPNKGYVVALPLGPAETEASSRAVITLLLEPRSKQALQTTLALIEVLAGYVHTHAARQQLRAAKAAGAAIDLAARLISAINTAEGFKGASLQLVNDLARQIGADRAALGWVRDIGSSGAVRLVAMSDTEHVDRRTNLVQKIEAAMDECLDQEQPIVHPAPPAAGEEGADALLSMAITHAHRDLASADAKLKVASVPLRVEDEIVGVVTIESAGDGSIELGSIELLQAAMDLVAPLLKLRKSDDRPLPARAWHSGVKAGAWAVGPRHTVWKIAAILTLVGLLTIVFVKIEYRVEAPMRVAPLDERLISMPFNGLLQEVPGGVEPGKVVEAGEVLARLDTDTLLFQRLDALEKLRLYQAQADEYRNTGETFKEQQALAQAAQAEASVKLYDDQIEKATIRAPISGKIIEGDLTAREGSTLKIGEPLFRIAAMDEMIVLARVRDEDIRLVQAEHNASEGAAAGWIVFQSDPSRSFPVTVERIVPMAQPEEGQNAFVVRARFTSVPEHIAPGMEGVARFDTGKRPIIGVLSRRLIDKVRLWMFW